VIKNKHDTPTSKETEMKDSESNEQSQCKTGMRDLKSLSDARKSYEEKNMGNHSGVGEADDRVLLCAKCKVHPAENARGVTKPLCTHCWVEVMCDF